MNFVKSFAVALVGLSISGLAFAGPGPGPGKPEKFEEHKTKMLADLDQRIVKIQEHRACVAAAANPDGMKKCRDAMKAFHDEMSKQRRGGPGRGEAGPGQGAIPSADQAESK